jgi:hypothetical protein
VKARSFLIGSALLLCFATGVFGGGAYQRTKDGKTLVWNPDQKQEDAASWSGGRDPKRYATGHGTLTWYKIERRYGMGSRLPIQKEIPVIRYSGNMVRGKFEGSVVAIDDQGKKSHATFVDGARSDEWIADSGPAPAPSAPSVATPTPIEVKKKPDAVVAEESVAEKAVEMPTPIPEPKHTPEIVREAVAASSPPPAPLPKTQPTASIAPLSIAGPTTERQFGDGLATTAPKARQSPAGGNVDRRAPFPSVRSPRSRGVDAPDLLQSLVVPPSTIPSLMKIRGEVPPDGSSPQSSATASPTPTAAPRLTNTEVVGLADAEARIRGYDLDTYQRPQAEYSAANDTWSVAYKQKSAAGSAGTAKNFTIRVEDKTKNMSIDR